MTFIILNKIFGRTRIFQVLLNDLISKRRIKNDLYGNS